MTGPGPEDTVLRELRDDGVLVLTLNRPGRHNAWELDMEERYFGLLDDATADPDVRVIVLTGAGDTFCPGMDISRLTRSTTDPTYVRPVRRPQTYALGVPKPIVAAVTPFASRASTTSVVQSRVLVVSLLVSGSNFLTVTEYFHFAPFASGRGSAAIISCIVMCRFAPLLHAPDATTVATPVASANRTPERRVVVVTRPSYSRRAGAQIASRSGLTSCMVPSR